MSDRGKIDYCKKYNYQVKTIQREGIEYIHEISTTNCELITLILTKGESS